MKKKLIWIIPLLLVVILVCSFFIYTGIYYHADNTALSALQTTETVLVEKTNYGWYFDGPSNDNLLVFYPGAKVEESAYAPLLRLLAESGMDVCLVKMPLRLAFFGANKAESIFAQYTHKNKFVGGHSLGGAFAANYAAKHGDEISGLIMLAAYSTKTLGSNLCVLNIYGSKDGVLNMDKVEKGRKNANDYFEYVIEGGNHAQFGNYGAQKKDGAARISAEEQQQLTVAYIMSIIN